MSSEVAAKCTHSSSAAVAPRASSSPRIQYSTAFTSCLVRDSMCLMASTSVALGSSAKRRAQSRALAGSEASAAAAGPAASASSQAHSTRTRSRMKAASEKISRTALSFAA